MNYCSTYFLIDSFYYSVKNFSTLVEAFYAGNSNYSASSSSSSSNCDLNSLKINPSTLGSLRVISN